MLRSLLPFHAAYPKDTAKLVSSIGLHIAISVYVYKSLGRCLETCTTYPVLAKFVQYAMILLLNSASLAV